MALAQAIIEYVHSHVRAKTLFSTHYHELTALENSLDHLKNVHVGATEKNGELVFLHKVSTGPADKSYGIHVAKLAGMPTSLLKRADAILQKLEQKDVKLPSLADQKSSNYRAEPISAKVSEPVKDDKVTAPVVEQNGQLELFETPTVKKESSVDQRIIHQLKELNLMGMTPMDVMNQIYKWQQKLK